MVFLPSRSFRRRRRSLFTLLLMSFVLFLLDTTLLFTSHVPPQRTDKLSPGLVGKKIYIASIHRNSEYILRWYWNEALVDLCRFLGPQNVFVSIVESGSQENTKEALTDLKEMLDAIGVQNRIQLGETVQEQIWGIEHPPAGEKKGWVETGRGETGWEKRRISALAETRNKAMEPLVNDENRQWDRVLWINDVIFTNEDIATLLSTRDGKYAAACSLDFQNNAQTYYDTFALRDSSGKPTISTHYPFFASKASLKALYALLPIPVQSCWNGIVAFDATPFYPPSLPSHQNNKPLTFRAIPDSLAQTHLEASECCLIHTDNPLSLTHGVFLNPNVRVSYNESTYPLVNPVTGWPQALGRHEASMENFLRREKGAEGDARRSGVWPGKREVFWGRWRRRGALVWGLVKGGRGVRGRVRRWEREREREGGNGKGKGNGEEEGLGRGTVCLVDEMQVLYKNGWLHLV